MTSDLLDLHKTSSRAGLASGKLKSILSGGEVPIGTLTTEKPFLVGRNRSDEAGILRKSSLLDPVISAYGLVAVKHLPMQSGYRNKNYPLELDSGNMVNLIIYKREAGMAQTIKQAHRLGNYLHTHDFPARHTYDSRILRLLGPPREQFAGLYVYLPGETIPWEGYTMNHLKSLGKSMSDMHALLAALPQDSLPPATDVYQNLTDRMHGYFDNETVMDALNTKLAITFEYSVFSKFKYLLRALRHLPSQQPIHLDFVRSNILFAPNTSTVSGVLDFEKAAFGHPVIDIARTLAFLFVDCKYKTEEQTRKYFLVSGYNKRGNAIFTNPLVQTKSNSIDTQEALINFFLFYDFYKFLLHNPYESLRENKHFTRTKYLLISRGILNKYST